MADVSTRPAPGLDLRSRQALLVVVLVLLALVAAYSAGQRDPRLHHDEAGCLSAVGTISCELDDGWTVGVPVGVDWSDANGDSHEGGRPACLPPTGIGLEGPVRLTWLPVEVDGRSWRQVVHVACLD